MTKKEDTNSAKTAAKANDLSGSDWIRFSISVWNDLRKNREESKLKHPALFPMSLVTRLIQCFTTSNDHVILDPFMGSGTTILAAQNAEKQGIGFDINESYVQKVKERLSQVSFYKKYDALIYKENALNLANFIEPESVHLCVTSPPYWDILLQKRSADNKEIRNYGSLSEDMGRIADYDAFLDELQKVFQNVFDVLMPGKYLIINVMDLRKKEKFYPLHSDLAKKVEQIGFIYDDVIIWDRRQEYNNLRALGYPYVFRLNKIHEYLLIFKKPKIK